MHANSKYSDEVRNFAINMWMKDKKTKLVTIQREIINRFGVKPSVDTVSDFLKSTGEYKPRFYRSEEVEFKKRVRDIETFQAKMSKIKALKRGDKIKFVICLHAICGGYEKRVVVGEVINVYNGYIHTTSGCVQFDDVKEVLKDGQEKQKEAGIQSAS